MVFIRSAEIRVVFGFFLDEGVFGGGGHAEVLAQAAIAFHWSQNAGFADCGMADPFAKLEQELFFGFFLIIFEPGFLNLDAAGVKVAAAKADDILGEDAEGLSPLFEWLRVFSIAVHQEMGVIEGEEAKEGIGQIRGGVGEVFGIGGEFAFLFEDLLAAEPVAVAAIFPFVDVLGQDGATAEVLGQDGFDFGHLVQFAGEVFGGKALVNGLVDALAELAGKAGDFAVAVVPKIKIEIYRVGGLVDGWIGFRRPFRARSRERTITGDAIPG